MWGLCLGVGSLGGWFWGRDGKVCGRGRRERGSGREREMRNNDQYDNAWRILLYGLENTRGVILELF